MLLEVSLLRKSFSVVSFVSVSPKAPSFRLIDPQTLSSKLPSGSATSTAASTLSSTRASARSSRRPSRMFYVVTASAEHRGSGVLRCVFKMLRPCTPPNWSHPSAFRLLLTLIMHCLKLWHWLKMTIVRLMRMTCRSKHMLKLKYRLLRSIKSLLAWRKERLYKRQD